MNSGCVRFSAARWLCVLVVLGSASACLAEAAGGKMKVCVMRFDAEGELSPHLGSFIYNTVIDRFVASEAFTVVDWEQINQTQTFIQQAQPDMPLQDSRILAARQLGVERMYFGSVSKLGRKYYLQIKSLRTDLTVERSERVAVASEGELEEAAYQLADRLILPRARMVWAGGTYDGCVLDGKPQGPGTLYYGGRDGMDRYEGQWQDGKRNGFGTLFYAAGNSQKLVRCEGQWKDDEATGQGMLTWETGSKYIGELKGGMPEGAGTLYNLSGTRQEGVWKAGKLDGQAVIHMSNKDRAVGLCVMGKKEGTWTFYGRDGAQSKKVYADDRLASGVVSAR